MPASNHDLHGNVPDTSHVALLLVDVINDLEFPGGEELLGPARAMAARLAELKRRAKRAGIPAVYANDNFGRWQSDFKKLVDHCLAEGVRGRPVARLLAPEEDDYFVLKPKHSAFYSTTLDTLLVYLQARTLIITGMATDICVLFTANDAYMRDYRVIVPADCVAAVDPRENERALGLVRRVLKADTRPSAELDLEELTRPAT